MAKNRTIIGIICIALAFAVLLVALPIVNMVSNKKIAVVRAFNEIAVGHQIAPEDLETVEMSAYNLPEDVISDPNMVIGKYATCTIKHNDFLFVSKISDSAGTFDQAIHTLAKNEVMITIKFETDALARYLDNGDIIELLFTGDLDHVIDRGHSAGVKVSGTYIVNALRYVRVVALFSNGIPKEKRAVDESGIYAPPDEIGVIMTVDQANLYHKIMHPQDGKTAVPQVSYRIRSKYNDASSLDYIKSQDQYLKEHYNSTSKNRSVLLSGSDAQEVANGVSEEDLVKVEDTPTQTATTEPTMPQQQ
jgi:pilus assembly protein CpaB